MDETKFKHVERETKKRVCNLSRRRELRRRRRMMIMINRLLMHKN